MTREDLFFALGLPSPARIGPNSGLHCTRRQRKLFAFCGRRCFVDVDLNACVLVCNSRLGLLEQLAPMHWPQLQANSLPAPGPAVVKRLDFEIEDADQNPICRVLCSAGDAVWCFLQF